MHHYYPVSKLPVFVRFILPCWLILGLIGFSAEVSAKPSFKTWLAQVKQEALAAGISPATVNRTIKHIRWLPKVIKLDHKQPEFVTTFEGYYYSHITPKRVRTGRQKLRTFRTLLSQLEKQYGIPRTILLALWGMETNYGNFQGDTDTVSALATLAYEGRREAFFKAQLLDAMWVIDQHQLTFSHLNGSWAGAFGHLQFMPGTFKRYAKNGDNNPRIDLKHSVPDAMHSAANYLSTVGWHVGQPSAIQIQLPERFDYQLAQLTQRKTLAEWSAMGVVTTNAKLSDYQYTENYHAYRKRKNDRRHTSYHVRSIKHQPLATLGLAMATPAAIVLPQGWRGPAFMVFDNFHTLLDWNRSVNYALSVSFLASQLADQTVVVMDSRAQSKALSRLQMQRLQKLLKQFGFDPGPVDGYPGLKTQAAIRRYQLAAGLPADGFASLQLYYHLDRRSFNQRSTHN